MKGSIGQKEAFTKQQVKTIKRLLLGEGNFRDLCLFSVGIDTMLRSSDILKLTVKDISNQYGIKNTFEVQQKKTKQTNKVMLQEDTRKYLAQLITLTSKDEDDFLFTGTKGKLPISHVQHSRLVKKWCKWLDLDVDRYSTHSIRRTKASIIYRETQNIEVCRQLLGQSNCTATSRYLGISQEESLSIAAKVIL